MPEIEVSIELPAQGPQGIQGDAATVAAGATITASAGASASVANVGTPQAAIFEFTIPRGDIGNTGPGYAATSTTSVAPGTGTKAFSTQLGLAYSTGSRARAYSRGSGKWIEGPVASYLAGILTITADLYSGSGAEIDWNLNLAGEQGPEGPVGSGGVAASRQVLAGGIATGGGNLSADRTITVTKSTNAQALAGTDDATAMTPVRVKDAITAAGGATGFPSGTKMLFQQTAAPTGWTKDTTHNDKALRVVTGTPSSGGTLGFSTVFARTDTDSHTLSIGEMPSHSHTVPLSATFSYGASGGDQPVETAVGSTATNSQGGGTGHTHPMDMRIAYVDLIIATKT